VLMATLYNTDRILLDYDVPYELFKEKYLPIIIKRANELLGNLFLDYGITRSQQAVTPTWSLDYVRKLHNLRP